MKRFSTYVNENSVTSDVNPGNAYPNTGVTNHLTPVGNIVASIRNFWSPLTGIVASVGEDGFSVKLNSSKFVSQEAANEILYNGEIMRGTCLYQYIVQQGLPVMKCIPIGQYFIIYFCPNDIKAADKQPKEDNKKNAPVKEMLENDLEEVEMVSLIKESDDDEEIKDLDREKIIEIINSKDKVKAAKQLELFITSKLELPREYYFAGVKSKDGDESIALRWKYTRKRPHNKTSEVVRSIMNIFDDGKEGIWIQDFDKDGMVTLPDEVDKLIHTILDYLGASETNNPCVWSLQEIEKKDDEKKEDDEDKDKDENNEEDTKKKSNGDDEDDEDDSSRGDNDDLLK